MVLTFITFRIVVQNIIPIDLLGNLNIEIQVQDIKTNETSKVRKFNLLFKSLLNKNKRAL
ncbi:Uncharacterised protein (plasmid) [Mesomycoplasma conjunctivae]|uniref:Uncharacterized protein n=1 Tax=Mycoplasmopsis fermentans (strain M64) TaxID=943945 RepID=A0AB32XCG2_MYCFM|nr:Hypothetical Protein MfeM64YM_0763 [Mycoplasmopsis fermentans M64]VEU67235.1 Uncharacterised protein [Mesomycoplasma conjunctivae]